MNKLSFIISKHSLKKLAKILRYVIIIILDWRKYNVVTYYLAKTMVELFFKSYFQWLNKLIMEVDHKIVTKKIKFNKEAT